MTVRPLRLVPPLLAVLLAGPACRSVVCGDGTVLEGETCVPESLATCGAGTTLEGETCVPDTTACGTGTTLVDGKCTRSGLACGAGTEEINGECRILDPLRTVTVREGAEPNAAVGRFKEFTLPEIGAPAAVLGGVVSAPEAGQADLDVFQFAGRRNQRIHVEAVGVGVPVAGVVVQPADLTSTFSRFALAWDSRGGVRDVVLPFDGDWIVVVSDQSNLTGGVPSGSDDFSYLVRVSQVTPRAATPIAPGASVQGQHANLDSYALTPTAATGDLFDVVLDEPPADSGWPGARAVWLEGPDGALLADLEDQPPYVPIAPLRIALPTGTTTLYVDYQYVTGPEPAPYTLTVGKVRTTTVAASPTVVETPGDALPSGSQVFQVDITGPALLQVDALPTNGSQLLPRIEIRDRTYALVAQENATSLKRFFGPAESQKYYVVVVDRTFYPGKTDDHFVLRTKVDAVELLGPVSVDATADASATVGPNGDTWLALLAGNDGRFAVQVTPSGTEDLAAELRSVDAKTIVASANAGGAGAPESLPAAPLLVGGALLVRVVGPPSAAFTAVATGTAPDFVKEVEPNDDTTRAQALTLDPLNGAKVVASFATTSDTDTYAVTLAAAGRLVIDTRAGIQGSVIDTRVTLLAADGSTGLSYNDDSNGTDLSHIDYAAAAGTYYLRVQRWSFGAATGDYVLTVVTTP